MLGVVVVLDDQSAVRGPLDQLASTFAVEYDAGREVVRRGHHDHAGGGFPQYVDLEAAIVDRDRRGAHSPVLQVLPGSERAGVLDGDLVYAALVEHLGDDADRLGHAGDDDQVVLVGRDAAVTRQPVRDGSS